MLFDVTASGINIDDIINPQNIKERFVMLSAKNPNTGCKRDENICDTVRIIAAIDIESPISAAIKGIIGFNIPVYISFTKCPPDNHIRAFLFWDKSFVIRKLKIKR